MKTDVLLGFSATPRALADAVSSIAFPLIFHRPAVLLRPHRVRGVLVDWRTVARLAAQFSTAVDQDATKLK